MSGFDINNDNSGYWLAYTAISDVITPVAEIIYVMQAEEGRVDFLKFAPAADIDIEDTTGRDIYKVEPEGGCCHLPLTEITFRTRVFAISMGAYLRARTWGDNVFVMRSEGLPVDDNEVLFNDLLNLRTTIQAKMTAHIPTIRPRTFTIPFSTPTFKYLTNNTSTKTSTKQRFGQWTFTPASPGPTPTSEEYTLVVIAMKVTPAAAFNLVKAAKAAGTPIILKKGAVTTLQVARRRLIAKCQLANDTHIKILARFESTTAKVSLTPQQISHLELEIGPFTSKTPRNATIATRFIEDRREGDPDYVEACTMSLEYLSSKGSLRVSFRYHIRNSIGQVN